MKKPLFILFAGLLITGACHQRNGSTKARGANESGGKGDTVITEEPAAAPDFAPDSSMILLKSGKAVVLTDALSQFWKMEDADQPHWNEIFWDSLGDKRQFPELALYRDFTVTENPRCGIRMGTWQLIREKKQLQLRFSDGTRKTYIVRQIALKQMSLDLDGGNGDKTEPAHISLSAKALVYKRPEEDPFHPANNRWRLIPKAPETREQIHTRLKGYVHFYSLFFRDNRLRQETDISFADLPACLVWYNGGIGLPMKKDLDQRWIQCFYSKAQALEAYDILEPIITGHVLKWPEHPTSWIKQTYEVLDQLHDKL